MKNELKQRKFVKFQDAFITANAIERDKLCFSESRIFYKNKDDSAPKKNQKLRLINKANREKMRDQELSWKIVFFLF